MHKIFRIISIIAVCVAIWWFGLHFGVNRDDAAAKVFERLRFFTKAMPGYLFDDETSTPRKVIVNGNATYLTLGKTDDSVDAVLNFYARQYEPLPMDRVDDGLLEKIDNEEVRGKLNRIYSLLECLEPYQHFRVQRDDWGLWGTFEFHDSDLRIGSCEFVEQLQIASQTGNLGQIGTGRITIALRGDGASKTLVMNLWTDRDFNINNLKPDEFGDMPGKDIDDVPRYPGNRRQLSIEQENSRTVDSIVVYEGEGSLASNILFYHSGMKAAGWATDPGFEALTRKKSMENLLFYARKGRECTIQINEDEGTGKIITTVMDRETI
ncbi:MAG: hypothetical protein AMK69_01545 [Nitrospira bacterium SG8_3]|nr:MAG: hypothetical protein AMK69_01545 [Nitrospira bacterium SG8_3]